MSKKLDILMAAFLAASVASGTVLAVDEVEKNNPAARNDSIGTAQRLEIGTGGSVEVNGVLGVLSGPATNDVDFYSFEGREGDVVTVDIDGGMKLAGSGMRSVDTIVALFGPGPCPLSTLCAMVDDAKLPLDPGSIHRFDARIDPIRLPRTGIYTVGVSSAPRFFNPNGTLRSTSLNSTSNGSYTLVISGVTPPIQQINIAIKPDSGEYAPINPKSKGSIPVALVSSAEFNALGVDYGSITFGADGTEASLLRCAREGEDVDGDGRPDLMCHFDSQTANFEPGDTEGIVMGKTTAGRRFEGRGHIRIVGGKRPE
jgi:methionine-rich copper-binding protein CopC